MTPANTRLPVDVYSPAQLSRLIVELHNHIDALRDAQTRNKVAKTDTTLPAPAETLTGLLNSNSVAPDNLAKLESLHADLQLTLKKAPMLHLTLAALPSRTLKRQLTVWFRVNIHATALITFAARNDIGGGFMLQAGSRFYDHSFKNLILAHKSRLMEIANV